MHSRQFPAEPLAHCTEHVQNRPARLCANATVRHLLMLRLDDFG